MASVDSEGEKRLAENMGWRTYRVRLTTEPLIEREAVCPASDEADHKLQCVTCGYCNGSSGRRGSVAIIVHGAKARQPERRFVASRAYDLACSRHQPHHTQHQARFRRIPLVPIATSGNDAK